MLPSIEDWLSASWEDFRRRWSALMVVLTVGGLATAAAVLLPMVPAGLAGIAGAGWGVWGAACVVSLFLGMWLSTWTQAAAVIAAAGDVDGTVALGAGWRQTPAFAWVLSVVTMAACGGLLLLFVPGLILGALLFFAPFYQLSGEENGLAAAELSFARVRPVFGPVFARLAVAGALTWAPAWIPYVGWLLGPLWAPFGLVACARLAADLKTLNPTPPRPSLRAPILALAALFTLATFAMAYGATTGAMALYRSFAAGKIELRPPDAETAQSLLAVLEGKGSAEDKRRSATYVLSLSSGAVIP